MKSRRLGPQGGIRAALESAQAGRFEDAMRRLRQAAAAAPDPVPVIAALGTMLMPGVGTGAGASVGGKIGEGLNKLFGK